VLAGFQFLRASATYRAQRKARDVRVQQYRLIAKRQTPLLVKATPFINPLFKDGVYDPGKTAGKEAIHFTQKLAQGVDTREIGVDAVVAKQDGLSALADSVHVLLARSPVTSTTK